MVAVLCAATARAADAQQSAEMKIGVTVTPACTISVPDRTGASPSAVTFACGRMTKAAQPLVRTEASDPSESTATTSASTRRDSNDALLAPQPPSEQAVVTGDKQSSARKLVINF